MQYSPKLKKAMKEIIAVLEKYDVAGCVILHTPGYSEICNHLNPSYSCVSEESDGYRVKLVSEELPGGKKQAIQIANDTFNMAAHMRDVMVKNIVGYLDLYDFLKDTWDGESDDGDFTSEQQQNN